MNTAEVILAILVFSLIMNIYFFIRRLSEKNEYEVEEIDKYRIAIEIFNKWKREIGGVALRGVGQHFEQWLWKQFN